MFLESPDEGRRCTENVRDMCLIYVYSLFVLCGASSMVVATLRNIWDKFFPAKTKETSRRKTAASEK